MIDNLNYIISNGTSFKHFYNDGEICELFKIDLQENILWKKTFLESYHSQIATLNSDSKNVYFVNVNNIDSVDFTGGDSFIIINFIDTTSLRISFINSLQATHNNLYLDSAIFSRDILDYISVRTLLYVHQDNVEDIPNKIYNNLQTAINNQLPNEVILIQTGAVLTSTFFIITKSIVIYSESNVTLNGTVKVTPATSGIIVKIYGNPVLNGTLLSVNTVNPSDFTIAVELDSLVDSGSNSSNPGTSNILIKANEMNLSGTGVDSDSYLTSIDIDVLNLTTDSFLSHMSNSGVTSLYLRNWDFIANSAQMRLGETGGQYLVNFINCSFNETYIVFTDNTANEVRLWNSYILSSQTYSIGNETFYKTYLNLYGKNSSNKPADSFTEISGIGEYKIQTALEL